jgi:hypothetical protein
MMNPLDLIKATTELGVSIGVGAIVGNAIKLTTAPDTKKYKKVAIAFGGFVLSSMVSDTASKYATERIDTYASRVQAIFNPQAVEETVEAESEETVDPQWAAFQAWQKEQDKA